jgi:putative ABC transport system substrate-binding protein
MRRREFMALLGSAAAWPLPAPAQERVLPVVGFVYDGVPNRALNAGFLRGLAETGYVVGQNVTVESHGQNDQSESLTSLMADLVRCRVAVIATLGSTPAALAAKAATATIPIVFGIAGDPVSLGLVESFPRPGGNATGTTSLNTELIPKRLELLHELVPKAVRIAQLANANREGADFVGRNMREAALSLGLRITKVKAGSSDEIEAAFTALARDHADALFVNPDAFFGSRAAQFATLAARHGIPATYSSRGFVEAGGLMSYGNDNAEALRQAGAYIGRILNGARPADLPVVQSSKFELLINLKASKALGLAVPLTLRARADEIIE